MVRPLSRRRRGADPVSTLPLKFVPFERYMLIDDRPSHPMTFTIRLKFSGRFDQAAFEPAVAEAVARHPFLGAHVTGNKQREWTWSQAADPRPYIDYGDFSAPLRFPEGELIDLRTHTGLRIWVRTNSERTEIRFQFHHSTCDGIGAYRFLEDLLCSYDHAARPGQERVPFRPLDPEKLKTRTRFGMSLLRQTLRIPLEVWGFVVGLITFFLPRPVPSSTPREPEIDEQAKLTLLDYPAHTFDAAETGRLRTVARQTGATFNDLLLRDLLLGLHAWNIRFNPRGGRGLFRVMIPTNLRRPEDEALPAANVVAMVFVDRWMNLFRHPKFLLWTIKLETKFLKSLELAVSFIRCVATVGLIPGGIEFLASGSRCYATSVLSNMGRAFHECPLPRRDGKIVAGDLVLEAVESAPPIRPFTSTSFTVLSYADKLTLIMNYDRFRFTPETAQALLAQIVSQIQTTIKE
jgi:hypothetical protein